LLYLWLVPILHCTPAAQLMKDRDKQEYTDKLERSLPMFIDVFTFMKKISLFRLRLFLYIFSVYYICGTNLVKQLFPV